MLATAVAILTPMTAPTDPSQPFEHVCEVCGRTETLTADEAYQAGWDYPPHMGEWGVISSRTCDKCLMKDTLWWAVSMHGKTFDDLTPEQLKTAARIRNEVPD